MSDIESSVPPLQSPDNTDLISDFGKRSREFGKYLEGQEHSHSRHSVTPEDRQRMEEWISEARDHAVDPNPFSLDAVSEDRPLDYVVLMDIYRQLSDLVKDVG